MALTNFAALTDEEKTVWVRDVWSIARNASLLNKFAGDSMMSMVHKVEELTSTEKGDRAVITLVPDAEGDGVAGDRTLEGNEEALTQDDIVIRVDQLRHAHRSKGRMAEQRSIVNFREQARDKLGYYIADRWDQMGILTLSGVSYAFKNNGAARVGSDLPNLEFAADVSAPTTNRHRRWDATSGLVAGDTTAVADGDTPTWGMLVDAKAYAEENFIRPLKNENGNQYYVVIMSPRGLAKLRQDEDYLANVRNAGVRGASNELFAGTDSVMVDGMLIMSDRRAYTTLGATSGSGKWGAGNLVDGQRILMCGAQALAMADIGTPTWVEKKFDYDNQPGISVGKICGFRKPVFRSQVTGTDEDFGVLCIDTSLA